MPVFQYYPFKPTASYIGLLSGGLLLLLILSGCLADDGSGPGVNTRPSIHPSTVSGPTLPQTSSPDKSEKALVTRTAGRSSGKPRTIPDYRIEDPQTGQFYYSLLAELYAHQGDDLAAADNYLLAARLGPDVKLLKIATELSSRAGKTPEALEVATRWVAQSPKSLEAIQYQALLQLRSGQYEQAAETLDEIYQNVEKNTDKSGRGTLFISKLLQMESHHVQALRAYQRYVRKYGIRLAGRQVDQSGPDHPDNKKPAIKQVGGAGAIDEYSRQQMTLASLAMKSGQYQTVINTLKNDHTEIALLLRAKALNRLGQTSESIRIMRPLIRRAGSSDSLKLEFIRYLVTDNKKDEAILRLKKVVNKYPENKDLLKSLIVLELDQKRWNAAKTHVNQLMESKDYQSDAHHYMGEIYEARGDITKALKSYRQVLSGSMLDSAHQRIPVLLEKNRGLPAARFWLHRQRLHYQQEKRIADKKVEDNAEIAALNRIEADLLLSRHHLQTALEFYQRAMVYDPENSDIRYRRALAYEQQGNIALAEQDFQHILKSDSEDSVTLNALGYLLTKYTQRFDEALNLIKKAHDLAPDNPTIMDSLGWVYYRLGEMATAEHYLRKAYRKMKVPEVASHLITVLNKQGQKQEARLILMHMLRLFPDNEKMKQIKQRMHIRKET